MNDKEKKAVLKLMEITGRQPSSFQGGYEQDHFSISNHLD